LTHRADDYEEKVKVRLATYEEQTKPLLEYYEKTGRLKKVDGTGRSRRNFRTVKRNNLRCLMPEQEVFTNI
jgi:adenylate kinase